MKTDFITIKENESLKNLAARCKDSVENVTDFLLKKLVHYELVSDVPEECGLKLSEILYENGITITGFTLKIFGKCFTEILIHMEGLEIWGKNYECPECGCIIIEDHCTNDSDICGYTKEFVHDWDSMRGGRDYNNDFRNN